MNVELKAMLTVLFKMFALGEDLITKQGVIQDMTDVTAIALAVPAVITNWNDVSAEVKLLDQPANLADILAFIAAGFVGIDSDAKAQAILNASLKLASDLAIDGVALAAAIKA
jgi:hypothetical protein